MFDTPKNTLTSENVHALVIKALLKLPLQAKGKNVGMIDLLNTNKNLSTGFRALVLILS
jgi:hypothetical protein